jgi:Uri superfamily endonuclease
MHPTIDLPSTPGTYALILHAAEPITVAVGKLGIVTLPAGDYLYAGSARGPGGLRARVGRHLRQAKKPHWHIDALTAVLPVIAVWWAESPDRLECVWADAVWALPDVRVPVPGFGASDCGCESHLLAIPDRAAAQARIAATVPRLISVAIPPPQPRQ